MCMCACLLTHVQLFATPWTIACPTPVPTGILQATILEWVAMPSSRGSSQPRNCTQVSHIAGGFFTVWATREALFEMNDCNQKLDVRHSPSHMGSNKQWKQALVVVTVHLLSGVMTWTVAHRLLQEVCSNSCSLSQWCYLGISFSTAPFSFCLQPFPASRSFPVSRLFSSDGQSTEASVSVAVSPSKE